MTGKAPHVTGVYNNPQIWRHILPDEVTLPQHFRSNGYWAAGAGKNFHNNMPDPVSWDDYFPSLIRHMPEYCPRFEPGRFAGLMSLAERRSSTRTREAQRSVRRREPLRRGRFLRLSEPDS